MYLPDGPEGGVVLQASVRFVEYEKIEVLYGAGNTRLSIFGDICRCQFDNRYSISLSVVSALFGQTRLTRKLDCSEKEASVTS